MSQPHNKTEVQQEKDSEKDPYQKIIGDYEEELEKRKQKKARKDGGPSGLLESVYMLIFALVFLFGLGGIHGHLAINLQERAHPHHTTFTLIPASGSFMERYLNELKHIAQGFGHHFKELWYLDLTLTFILLCVIFGIKQSKKRRRYFSLAISACLFSIALFILKDLLTNTPLS